MFRQDQACFSHDGDRITANLSGNPTISKSFEALSADEEEQNDFQASGKFEGADDEASLVERFSSELTSLGGKVTCCEPGEIAKYVLELLKKLDSPAILAWEAAHLPEGLLTALRDGGITIHHEPDPTIRVGLTGALAGIARTGSVALTGGAGRPLSASLLTEVHIMILRKEDIYEDLASVLKLPEIRQATSSVIITGPSRTADIEMALTIGVHGPGEVHVLLI